MGQQLRVIFGKVVYKIESDCALVSPEGLFCVITSKRQRNYRMSMGDIQQYLINDCYKIVDITLM